MKDAGRIGFLIRGDYDPLDTYEFLDIVYYNEASYVAKKTTTGNIPTDNDEYWQAFAKAKREAGAVTGVKGEDELNYRVGDVNITKENIGLGNVQNLSQEEMLGGLTSENINSALGYDLSLYLVGKANKSLSYPVTLQAGSWTGESAPYSIAFSLEGLLDQSVEIIPDPSVTSEQVQAFVSAQIVTGTTEEGSVTLKAYGGNKPEVDLPIIAIIRGDS